MNRQKVAVGPGASSLILIAVVLTLCVLTVLTMVSARSDEAMARRSLESRQEVYSLFAAGEVSLSRLDAVLAACRQEKPDSMETYLAAVEEKLPEGMKISDDLVSWTEKKGNRSLECTVRILKPESDKRTQWTSHRLASGVEWEDDGFDDFDDFEDEEGGESVGPEEETGEAPEENTEAGEENVP